MSEKEIKDKALKLLSRREHSRLELRQKLLRRDFNFSEIEPVLDELAERGYIDDERFAEEWIHSRKNSRPRGRFLIRAELKEKGVSSDIIEDKLNSMIAPSEEVEMAVELARKWLRGKDRDQKSIENKLSRYLYRKGFSRDIIRDVISNLTL